MPAHNLKFLLAGCLALGFFVVAGVVVHKESTAFTALVTPLAPATPQKTVQRPVLDLWPLLLTLRHIGAFSGSGWENFHSQMTSIAALPSSAQPAALKKLATKIKTDKTVVASYRPSIIKLLITITNRVQKGNLRIIAGTKFERAVPPVASLAEFLKLGLLPKPVTASLQKTAASLQKLPIEAQMQKLAATALDLQTNKTLTPALRNITWELHAITAFILSGETQTVLCTDLAGETAPATIAACNAQGGTVYDAQCLDVELFAEKKSVSFWDRNFLEFFPYAHASFDNAYDFFKPDNKLTACEKTVKALCKYSGISDRPYTPGKYICGDFALDMKEWLWQVIQGKIFLGGKESGVVDEELFAKLKASGKSFANRDAFMKPDPRVKITGASTDLAVSLIHFFNDAECTDEEGESQKIYFDAASCGIFDQKIEERVNAEHVITEKNKVSGERFIEETRRRKEEYANYWQKQELEKIRNPKPITGQRAAADNCGDLGAKVPGWQVIPPSCPSEPVPCPEGNPFPTCSVNVAYQAGSCVPDLNNPGTVGYYVIQKVVTSPDAAEPYYKTEFRNVYACATTNQNCPPPTLDCGTAFQDLQLFR